MRKHGCWLGRVYILSKGIYCLARHRSTGGSPGEGAVAFGAVVAVAHRSQKRVLHHLLRAMFMT